MSGWWVADLWQENPAFLIGHVVVVVMAIVLHELAHGFAAQCVGDDTPVTTGHMTLNPIVHMGGFGLLLFALTGYAFGAMPVSPWRFRGRYADAFVAFAGPAMNLVLALLFALGLTLWSRFALGNVHEPLYGNVEYFLNVGTILNFVLLILNLLPIPPLDGATVLGNFVRPFRAIAENPSNRMIFNILLLLVLVRGSSMIQDAGFEVGVRVVGFFHSLLPG
jgi:Zn-dependent protease